MPSTFILDKKLTAVDLLETIESLRASLIESGMKYGLTHIHTIELSCRLDEFINKYQMISIVAAASSNIF